MELPALPGATITSTGRQATSLRDGLAIRLTTSMSVAEARELLPAGTAARGWTEQAGPGQAAQAMLPNLPLARLAFRERTACCTPATITANDGTARVDINLVEP